VCLAWWCVWAAQGAFVCPPGPAGVRMLVVACVVGWCRGSEARGAFCAVRALRWGRSAE
jgi:hypothetical protein